VEQRAPLKNYQTNKTQITLFTLHLFAHRIITTMREPPPFSTQSWITFIHVATATNAQKVTGASIHGAPTAGWRSINF
jgi:hypothetical protein